MDEDVAELERKLLATHPPLDSKSLSTVGIPLTPSVRSIQTRDELTNIPPRREESGPYTIGDLLWVKMPGFPHWPAMISRDPTDGRFARSSASGFTYHVQYFGEATRNWAQAGKFWPFEGAYLILPNTKKSVLPKTRKKTYEAAIAEALQASKLDQQTRVKKLTFNYILVDPKANSTLPRTPSSAKKKKIALKSKAKNNNESVYDFDETIDDIEQEDTPELVWSRPREPTPPPVREPSPQSPLPEDRSPVIAKEHSTCGSPAQSIDQDLEQAESKPDLELEPNPESKPEPQLESEPESKSRSRAKPTKAKATPTPKSKPKTKPIAEPEEPELAVEPLSEPMPELEPIEAEANNQGPEEADVDLDCELEPTISQESEQTEVKRESTVSPSKRGRRKMTPAATTAKPASATKAKRCSTRTTIANSKIATNTTTNSISANNSTDTNSNNIDDNNDNSTTTTNNITATVTKNGKINNTSMNNSRPVKKMRGSSVVRRAEPPAADVMTSSEDASSTSDLEAPDMRLDKLCNICHEESGTFYFCSGTCLRTMHAACGGSESTNNNSDNFICQECKTGRHPCFVCKSTEGECIKCCHKNCGKYYHIACLNPHSYPANVKSESNTFTCPMHYCLSCYTDQPYQRDINCLKPSKRQLMKCLSCPTAFHNDDACTAAGTVSLAGNYVMCPAHRSTKNEKHLNVSWCFSCNEGGDLICCESCPAAFHGDCIDNPPKSEDEQYFCYDCQSRKQLHYGDIIWIKLGSYRWWPAKIIHPNMVPENIMKLSHTRGDFPVYFFGSHDYYWSHRGRVFVFVEEDGQIKYNKSGPSEKKFKIAVEEARAEYAERKIQEDERMEKIKNMEKPRFRLIKQNRPVNNVSQSTHDDIQMSAKQRCECKPDGDVLCGTDDCLNRLMMLECEPSTCPVAEKCKNQRFRKRQYPVCVPFKTDHVGWGLRTTQDIKKGDFVIEYVGELIDEAECNRRMDIKMDKGDTTFYFLTIDKERIIDAGPAANHARFMNHSCQPNCETQKWVVNGQTKVGLFALCDIPAGTELTFNYNLDCRGNEKMQCRCNSENCSGYIGLPVKNVKKS